MPRPTAATAQARARPDSAVDAALARGNRVRAALRAPESEARRILDPLVVELRVDLDLDSDVVARLGESIPVLLERARRGPAFNAAARVLFDLQALTHSASADPALDFIDWIRTLGRRPYRRERPLLFALTRVRRLDSAIEHLRRIDAPQVRELARALAPIHSRLQTAFRSEAEPAIASTLDELPFEERTRVASTGVARDVVDRMLARGEASFSDLRDAISRNDLSLRDLRFSEFVFGDTLHRADTQLGTRLDGAYVRGEFYLRLLQTLQSTLFGTKLGRLLARFVLGPFGASYIVLRFVEYVAHHVVAWTMGHHARLPFDIANPISVLGLGTLLCLVLNTTSLRNAVWARLPFVHHHGHDDEGNPGVLARIAASAKSAVRSIRGTIAPYRYWWDERLRYRTENRDNARWSNALLALAAFLLGYVFRFAFKLIIEPSVNPIKHFPVVTVAGKISIASGLPILLSRELNRFLPLAAAGTLGSTIAVLVLPGISGFLAWELRLNWMLYQTQREQRESMPPPDPV